MLANNPSASKTLWIKNPLAVFSGALNGPNAERDLAGGLVIQGSQIIECVAAGKQPSITVDQQLDASDMVLLPGLINTHHHFYQTLTRCLPAAINQPLFPWLKTLYPIWSGLTPKHIELATELACWELMLSGATTVADHHYVFNHALSEAIDIQAEVVGRLGVRATLTRGSMSLSQKDGGLPPDSVVQTEQQILDDSLRLIKRYHDASNGSMLNLALAPCSPFSVTETLMCETARLAKQQGVRLHTHLGETIDENDFCVEKLGMRPVDYLEHCGWMGPQTWLAHGIHFDESEIQRLGAAQVGIAHCATSNMVLASGICPTLELEAAGCKLGLAVDGSASNDSSNMIQELRHSLMQQRLRYRADQITHHQVLNWATQGSAAVLGRDDIGVLAPGKQADIGLYKLDGLNFSGAHDPLAALVLCGASQVSKLMVAGKWVIEDAEATREQLNQLKAQHHQLALQLVG
ncbi:MULTISPECIES: 8-oxoguanine deaminase [unclassified Agarivorans]|uniref:8-oxoguanine deaminase n=1 Tax=unclassified Agarivorans TaxID=2636026 RepID=UPI0026E192E8|nr:MULTISPECIES: 8-oxoguanine deaminase [unclassified Agarivorans]MDO6687054.1 8-oxoguanine deaminase [Agarivorans sp. 3_MG-2023]MDO6713534.1 8-oxoguanine deaminase [Agarivorans sp. 2_MG-2023]